MLVLARATRQPLSPSRCTTSDDGVAFVRTSGRPVVRQGAGAGELCERVPGVLALITCNPGTRVPGFARTRSGKRGGGWFVLKLNFAVMYRISLLLWLP